MASWSNAYTFWVRYDKHARAHRNLLTPAAEAMIAHLRAGQPQAGWKDAGTEPRCLACHVTPQLAAAQKSHLWAEGVSCDACHTIPGRTTSEWYGPHQLARKNGWDDAEYERYGLRRLDTAARRAAVCAGCHVGAPAGDGIPVREVTHDLIAAGHPRLNFEYVTYLALMPPHWVEREPGPGLPAQSWFHGQVESAKSGLALHADRCERLSRGDPVAWPELAEWNCYACHHDLAPTPSDWRGRRADALTPRAPGQPLWTGGNIAGPFRQLLEARPETRTRLDRLASLAIRREEIAASSRTAHELATALGQVAANVPFTAADPAAGRRLVEALRLPERHARGELARMGWDDAAQTYYALRAASRCNRPPRAPPDDADRILDRIEEQLRLPRKPVYNSPWRYDPGPLAAEWVAVAAALERRGR